MSGETRNKQDAKSSGGRSAFGSTGSTLRKFFASWSGPARQRTQTIKEHEKMFRIPDSKTVELVKDFENQLETGLQKDNESSLKMMPSWITSLPTGHETGEFYAIDVGGTNLRILYCQFGASENKVEVQERNEIDIPETRKHGTIQNLFDFIVASFRIFLDMTGRVSESQTMDIGFCFSFPLKMEGITVGIIAQLTKGFDYHDAIGKDAVQLLRDTFVKNGFQVRIAVICNDSVGVLAAGRYKDPRTEIGVVLGTGTNAACVEQIKQISKWSPGLDGNLLSAVNIEWGGFFSSALSRLNEDDVLDKSSHHPNQQLFEKMICGPHLGELSRIMISALFEKGVIFKDEGGVCNLTQPYFMNSPAVCEIISDETSSLNKAANTIERNFGVKPNQADIRAIKRMCEVVLERAGLLLACALSATIHHVRKGNRESRAPVVVAIDGSTFLKFDKFKNIIINETKRMLKLTYGNHYPSFQILSCEGGSSLGAAALAAARLHKSKNGRI